MSKKLNLSDLRESEIKYEYRKYPDGQQDIIIDPTTFELHIEIESRMNSWLDIEKIICATKSLRRLGVITLNLYIPYLLGARSDRKFVTGGNSYLVDVVAPIINSLNFNKVTVIDVHSDVAAACINNLEIEDNKRLVRFALESNKGSNSIISPDAGSLKKIYPLLEYIKFEGSLLIASKHRDIKTSKILSTELQISQPGNNTYIIDDICDGGRTFIEIAKIFRNRYGDNYKLYLIVTHGIFSNGYEELSKYFDGIYCTNSVKDCGDYWGNDLQKTNVKQLKVI